MIPYLTQPTLALGPVTLAAFGVIVATAVMTGLTLGARRFAEVGLDRDLGERFGWWVVVGGFLGAHIFSVLLYFPEKVAANPLVLLKLWEDISSFGGIVGAALAMAVFLRRRGRALDASARWAYADVAAYVFPVSLMIGRAACALAHDHPGTLTRFPLAVSLERPEARAFVARVYEGAGRGAELPPDAALAGMGFHDLGWYEFLYLALAVVPLVLAAARAERRAGVHRPGRFLVTFLAAYMPVRFALDFLRVGDARYAGLTPAQWAALAALAALPPLLRVVRRLEPRPLARARELPPPAAASGAQASPTTSATSAEAEDRP